MARQKMQGLADDNESLFDEQSFSSLNSAEQANSALRWFSTHASKFQTSLIEKGYGPSEIDTWMDSLWKRIIQACNKYGVPLNPTAEAQAKRLGI